MTMVRLLGGIDELRLWQLNVPPVTTHYYFTSTIAPSYRPLE
jgi:hypothetical protein